MKNSEKLGEAQLYWRSPPVSTTSKRSAAQRLASLGFGEWHIAGLINVRYKTVQKWLNPDPESPIVGGIRGWFDAFSPKTLDAMQIMAVSWEDDEFVSPTLARLVIQGGTGMHALAYYAGIPIEDLRKAVGTFA